MKLPLASCQVRAIQAQAVVDQNFVIDGDAARCGLGDLRGLRAEVLQLQLTICSPLQLQKAIRLLENLAVLLPFREAAGRDPLSSSGRRRLTEAFFEHLRQERPGACQTLQRHRVKFASEISECASGRITFSFFDLRRRVLDEAELHDFDRPLGGDHVCLVLDKAAQPFYE